MSAALRVHRQGARDISFCRPGWTLGLPRHPASINYILQYFYMSVKFQIISLQWMCRKCETTYRPKHIFVSLYLIYDDNVPFRLDYFWTRSIRHLSLVLAQMVAGSSRTSSIRTRRGQTTSETSYQSQVRRKYCTSRNQGYPS